MERPLTSNEITRSEAFKNEYSFLIRIHNVEEDKFKLLREKELEFRLLYPYTKIYSSLQNLTLNEVAEQIEEEKNRKITRMKLDPYSYF